jgi:hypothetical protein
MPMMLQRKTLAALLAGIAVFGFWGLMMGLLLHRETGRNRPNPHSPFVLAAKGPEPAAQANLSPGEDEEWMGIYLEGEKVGQSWTLTRKTPEGIEVSNRTALSLVLMGAPQQVTTSLSYSATNQFILRSFDFSLGSSAHVLRVKGQVRESTLLLTINSGGLKSERSVPLKEEIRLPDGLERLLVPGRVKKGRVYRFSVFDPTTLSPGDLDITYAGEEEITLHHRQQKASKLLVDFQGLRSTVYVDPSGHTLREESPVGLVSLREDRGTALAWRPDSPALSVDLLQHFAVPAEREIPNPRQCRYLKAAIFGLPADYKLPTGGGQHILHRGEPVVLEVGGTDEHALDLPPSDGEVSASAAEEFLAPTALVQSDDSLLVRQARSIVKDETDPRAKVDSVLNWMSRNLERRPTVSIPSALDVLQTREGDCNEHATLFAALSRAAGVPTKILSGIVYADWPRPAFYYHAWNAVLLSASTSTVGGQSPVPIRRWVGIDPVFGQRVADATHISLSEGDPQDQLQLLRLLGKLRINLLKISS